MGLISGLYKASKILGKAAGKLNDVKTLASGDPVKIAKRMARKATTRSANSVARDINRILK